MNDSLSIDEIIKQAEEIREKTVKKAQSALEDVNNSAKEITEREIEVPKPEPENIKIASKSENFQNSSKTKLRIKQRYHLQLRRMIKQSTLNLSQSQIKLIVILKSRKLFKKAFFLIKI